MFRLKKRHYKSKKAVKSVLNQKSRRESKYFANPLFNQKSLLLSDSKKQKKKYLK